MTTKEQILLKLQHIESDLRYIKNHIQDIDAVLTDDDVEAIQAAEADLKSGRTKRIT